MLDWFHITLPINTFYDLLVKTLHPGKNVPNIYTQKKMHLVKRVAGSVVVIKTDRWNM